MFCGFAENFIHYPSWNWNEVQHLIGYAKQDVQLFFV
jgi:hypothetical protein